MARLLLFTGHEFKEVTCDSLDDYYRYLECDTFDITSRNVGGKRFDIFVDDIGLFKDALITGVSPELEVMLVGNLIFANHDQEGNTTSLSDADIKLIKKEKIGIMNSNFDDRWEAIVMQ